MFSTVLEHRVIPPAATAGLWWVLSGRSDWLTLSLGLGSVALTVYLARRMLAFDGETYSFVIDRHLVVYWCWLAWAIVIANFNVVRHVFAVPLRISPTWIRLHTDSMTEVGMATLANSITLTPGTVSLDVEDAAISVHALTQEAADYLQTGDMEHRARDPGREPRGI